MDSRLAPETAAEAESGRGPDRGTYFFDRRPWLLFAIAMLSILPALLFSSQKKLLWHDELFTYYIAQAPSLPEMMRLTQTLDLNPPLYYLAVRVLFHVLPVGATVCRIPSMAGFIAAMGCLFYWISKRFGPAWGIASVLLFATGAALEFAIEARPYGMELGFVALGFIGWQKATDGRSNYAVALILTTLGGFGALLSHVFAVFAWGAILIAEAVRLRLRGKLQWALLLALVFPLTAIATYLPLIRNHGASYFPAAFQASFSGIGTCYTDFFAPLLMPLIWTAAMVFLFAGRPIFQVRGELPVSTSASTALLGLFFVPVVLICYLAYTHGAFFERYGIVATLAIAAMVPLVGGWLTAGRPSVAWLASFALFAGSPFLGGAILLAGHPETLSLTYRERKVCEACELAKRTAPDLPLVDASGLTFVEMDSRLDASFLSHVFYLTDNDASIRYAHASIFEGMAREKDAFHMRAKVESYSTFVKEHPRFLVLGTYDYPEDWLLRKLAADGAQLRLVGSVDDSQFRDKQLWRIDAGGVESK